MVINIYQNGQLGNCLLHLASFTANALEYEYRLYYLSFPEHYRDYFELLSQGSTPSAKVRLAVSEKHFINLYVRKKLVALEHFTARQKRKLPYLSYVSSIHASRDRIWYFDLRDPDFLRKAKSGIVFANGWRFHDPESLNKHLPLLRDIFRPKKQFQERVDLIIKQTRSLADIVIGVHLRKGDYRSYKDGIWYYDDLVYKKFMIRLQEIFFEGNKTCIFLICSDEKINADIFKDMPAICVQKPEIIDMYALASCDYLIGPPSTFSGWSSFYGSVPIYYIEDAARVLSIDDMIVGFHKHFTAMANNAFAIQQEGILQY